MNNGAAHLGLLIVNIIYAVSYGISKDVMDEYIPPFPFILIRILGATLLFWLLSRIVKSDKVEKKDFGRLALCGLFGVAANQLMFFEGLNNTISINASSIMVGTPLIVLILSFFMLGERISPRKFAGVCVGMLGALMIIFSDKGSGSQSIYGDLLILLNASSYGFYLVLVKPLMRKYNPLTVIRWSFTFGLLFALPFGLSGISDINWNLDLAAVAKVSFIIFAMTFLTYLLTVYCLGRVSPTVVSAYIYLQPVLATIIALYYGTETLTLELVLYASFIFIGVFLVSLPSNLAKSPPKLA
jgi:drug/metabolite transporter (DMT)-like permease